MKEIDRGKLTDAIRKVHWAPETIVNDWNFSGLLVGYRTQTDPVPLGEMAKMNHEELTEWWSNYAAIKQFQTKEIVLYKYIVNKHKELVYMPKRYYDAKDYDNEIELAKRIVGDLRTFFDIKEIF